MGLPQPGIFAVGTTAHGYVELDLVTDADRGWVTVLADLAERETTMGATNVVVAVRPELWASVSPGTVPQSLTGFESEVVGSDGFTMRQGMNAGAALVAHGEFTIIIAQLAAGNAALAAADRDDIAAFAGLYVLVTATVGVLLMKESKRIGRALLPAHAEP